MKPFGLLKLQFVVAKYQKIEGEPLETKKFESLTVPKKIERGTLKSGFANARKNFWLKQSLEPATAGLPLTRLKSIQQWYIQGELCGLSKKITRRERQKSALYLRLKKRKTLFLRKKLFENFFFRKISHSAEKCKRGTPLDLLTYIPL